MKGAAIMPTTDHNGTGDRRLPPSGYKMKYRPEPIIRLTRYVGWHCPPPMVGDPPREDHTWEDHRRAVYWHMMTVRRQVGLWMHAEPA